MIENADGTVTLHGQEALDGFARGVSALLEGNPLLHYKTKFQGIPISVENRKGSIRRGGKGEDAWETKMKHPYGRIPSTKGADGEAIDTYIGPKKDAEDAFVVHQKDPETGKFDEDKVMLGFDSKKKAKKAFLAHYNKPGFLGPISEVPMDKLKDKLEKVRKTGEKLAKIQEAEEYGVKGQKWGQKKQKSGGLLSRIPKVGNLFSGGSIKPKGQSSGYWVSSEGDIHQVPEGAIHSNLLSGGESLNSLLGSGLTRIRIDNMFDENHMAVNSSNLAEAFKVAKAAQNKFDDISVFNIGDTGSLDNKSSGKYFQDVSLEDLRQARSVAELRELHGPPEQIGAYSDESESRTLEAKRPKIYYARSYQRYGTAQEAGDLDFLEEAYPGHRIVALTRCRKRGRKNMGYFHNKVEEADEVIISPFKKNLVTAGVYSEAKHALKQGIPVKVLRRGQLLSVKEVEVLDNPNPKGEFGKFVLKRKRSKFR